MRVVFLFKKTSINEITLRDFKECVKLNSDSYKYRFKSLDPEFGFLKEEVNLSLFMNFVRFLINFLDSKIFYITLFLKSI